MDRTNIVMGPRRSGKTRILARWMADAPPGKSRVCIAPNRAMAAYVRGTAASMGYNLKEWRFISVSDLHKLRGFAPDEVEIGVDQIDHCDEDEIRRMGYTIGMATMTYPEKR